MPKQEQDIPQAEWLQEGPRTQVTPEIKAIADSIEGEGIEYIVNVCYYLHKHYDVPKEPPDRMKRTAEEILTGQNVTEEETKGLPEGKLPIGTCTEHGTAIRALCIAKGIPTVFVDTVSEDWIAVTDDWKKPDDYGGHIYLDVYIDGKWYIVHTTGNPKGPREQLIWEKGDDPVYQHNGVHSRVVARGLDYLSLRTEDGRELSITSKKEWHIFVNHEFPERIQKLERLPNHY